MAQQRIWCFLLVAGMMLGAASCGDSEVSLPADGQTPGPASDETRLFDRDGKDEMYFPVMDALEAANSGDIARLQKVYHPSVRDEISSEQRWEEALELWELNLETIRILSKSESDTLTLKGYSHQPEESATKAKLYFRGLGSIVWLYAVEKTPDGWKLLDPLGQIGENIPQAKPLKQAFRAAQQDDFELFTDAFSDVNEDNQALLPIAFDGTKEYYRKIGNSLSGLVYEYRGGPDRGQIRIIGPVPVTKLRVIRVNEEWKFDFSEESAN